MTSISATAGTLALTLSPNVYTVTAGQTLTLRGSFTDATDSLTFTYTDEHLFGLDAASPHLTPVAGSVISSNNFNPPIAGTYFDDKFGNGGYLGPTPFTAPITTALADLRVFLVPANTQPGTYHYSYGVDFSPIPSGNILFDESLTIIVLAPAACQTPQTIFTDDTGAAGLLTSTASTLQLVGGKASSTITVSNPLRFWLGVLDVNIDPSTQISLVPNLAAGATGAAAALGLLTPCGKGLVSCSEPGGGSWVSEFCSPGSVTLQIGETPLSAAVTLTDLFAPDSPPSVLTEIADELVSLPSFAAATNCFMAGGRTLPACVSNNLRNLAFDPVQRRQFIAIFAKAGITIGVGELFQELLAPVALGQIIVDTIVFDIQTANAGHPGVMKVRIVGQ
jgi:hypothetical protein